MLYTLELLGCYVLTDVDVKDVFSHELAPVPTSMFTQDGMRIFKAKSQLKNMLQIEVSRRNVGSLNVVIIDGSALFGLFTGQQVVQ